MVAALPPDTAMPEYPEPSRARQRTAKAPSPAAETAAARGAAVVVGPAQARPVVGCDTDRRRRQGEESRPARDETSESGHEMAPWGRTMSSAFSVIQNSATPTNTTSVMRIPCSSCCLFTSGMRSVAAT